MEVAKYVFVIRIILKKRLFFQLPGRDGAKLPLEASLSGGLVVLVTPAVPVSVPATPTPSSTDPAHIVGIGEVLAGAQLVEAAVGGALREGRVRQPGHEQEEGQG